MYRCACIHPDTSFGLPGHVYAFCVMYDTAGTPSQYLLEECERTYACCSVSSNCNLHCPRAWKVPRMLPISVGTSLGGLIFWTGLDGQPSIASALQKDFNDQALEKRCMSTVQLLIDIENLAHADYMTGTLNSGIPYLGEVCQPTSCSSAPHLPAHDHPDN